MLINLSESNYSIKRNVRYFPWPRGATEKSLTCSGLRDPKIKHTHARALPASEAQAAHCDERGHEHGQSRTVLAAQLRVWARLSPSSPDTVTVFSAPTAKIVYFLIKGHVKEKVSFKTIKITPFLDLKFQSYILS